ncbi:BNR repeat-containing protein [Jiangella endophytica]|uniref:BNR repeat-containing protein n=1 Tax=Jiangella endophytica TaxID=1623398 RepID=UPI000E34F801|nr:BNR repeat-containing protein [Jiangella endophytica]
MQKRVSALLAGIITAAVVTTGAALTPPGGGAVAAAAVASPGPLECGVPDESGDLDQRRDAVLDTVEVGSTWAGHYVGQALLTAGDDQYVGYYDENRQLTVAHRRLGTEDWTRQRVDTNIGWDSHNYITIATDRAGNLHVTGNMHNHRLRYWRTTIPGDVTSLERVDTMANPELESSVTYPVFLELADGTLVFRYREGSSGDGVDVYNEYDEQSRTWNALLESPLLSGEGERNAYAAKPRLGPDGFYHMVWVWRETYIASTTNNVSYARSADLVNWETSAGEALELPITRATGDVVDPIPPEGGVINNNVQVGFDADGAPVVAYHKYDEAGNTQIYVATPDDSADGWHNVQVSDWTGAWEFSQGGTLVFEVELYWAPQVTADDTLRLDVTCHGEGRTFVLDGQTLEPIQEVATPPTEPASVSEVRSDYQHPYPGEGGAQVQVNLNDDSGASGSFHAPPLTLGPDEVRRNLIRWESLGENQDRPRQAWPPAQPLEVTVLGTADACKDEGWRTFTNPGFRGQGDCVRHVYRQLRP